MCHALVYCIIVHSQLNTQIVVLKSSVRYYMLRRMETSEHTPTYPVATMHFCVISIVPLGFVNMLHVL